MVKYLDLKGMEVVNGKGNIVGSVEDCIIDFKTKRIYSVIIKKRSFAASFCITTVKNLKNYKDVIMCSENYYKLNKKIYSYCKCNLAGNYINADIIDISGKREGSLMDILFEENTGEIKAIVCSRGFFDDIFNGRKLIMIDNNIVFGKDKIVVDVSNIDFTNNISFKKLFK